VPRLPAAGRLARAGRARQARAFEDWDYWGRPVPGFGDPGRGGDRRPRARGARREPHRSHVHRRPFGRLALRVAAPHGLREPAPATHRDDGLHLTEAWVTSPVKCAPPANKPTTDERDRCAPYLDAELELLPWRVIVALGGFGWDAVLRHLGWEGTKPRFTHGAEATLPGGGTLLGSYHVSQQNTFTGRLTEEMLDAVFLRAREIAADPGSEGGLALAHRS
jgi:uracil-DNA glycosylase